MTVSECFPLASSRHQAGLRLLLVDDHLVVRESLHALLTLEVGVEIVGEAANAIDGIELARRLSPDVVVTDLGLGTQSGLDLIAQLRKLKPAIKSIVLSMHNDDAYIRAAFSAGARGYVLKDSCHADLIRAIRAVHAGEVYVCAPVSEAIVFGYLRKSVTPILAGRDCLTERQREIVRLVALGMSSKRIAVQLGVSVKTVAKHRSNLSSKLDLRSTAAITTFAIRHGLLSQVELDSPSSAYL
jgi:two-component system nitrate/nitrite response regulator NarL